MAQSLSEHIDEEWEEVRPAQPDDTISVASDAEGQMHDDNDGFVEVDDPKKTAYPGRIHSNPTDDPTGPLPTLRKALYNLKDTLNDSIKELEDFNQEASDDALAISGPVMQLQQRQVATLNTLLTNYASDWEQYANEGGMTFDEFADLDPVAVDALGRIFKDFALEVKGKTRKLAFPDFASEIRARAREFGSQGDGPEDIAWLDIILPAVDEVSMLLRVPEHEDNDEKQVHGEGVTQEETPMQAEHRITSEQIAAKQKDDQSQKMTDKVHQRMAIVSDW